MLLKLSTIIVFVGLFSVFAQAQEVRGIWAGAVEADEIFASIRLNFDESKIVLSFAGNELSGAIKNLKTANGEINFEAELRPRATFSGKIEDGKISGTFDILRSNTTKIEKGIWNVRKVDLMNFAVEKKTVSTDEKIELPKPAGAFSIGRKFFYWTDESRFETITDDPNDKRKVFVQLWYPAKKGSGKAAEYLPNLEELRGKDQNIETLRSIKTHAVQDAKPAGAKTKFPVIIFSPGLGSNPFFYAAIIENLVSRGYVVAAIHHPYDTDAFKFSDGQIIRNDEEKWNRQVPKDWTQEQRIEFMDERRFGWAQDISFVVNQLQKLDKSFVKRFDFENLGVFGHSFGGQATSIACASDVRFKACANLDGMAQGNVVLPNEKGEYLKQPFMYFNKSEVVTDTELKIMNLTRTEYLERERKRLLERWKPSFKNRLRELESGAYYALYPGVKHSSFGDSLLTNSKDILFADRFTISANINDYITAFFDKFLMKKSAPLFDDKNQTRPPVILEFLKKEK